MGWKNKDDERAYHKEYRARNPDKVAKYREQNKKYREENRHVARNHHLKRAYGLTLEQVDEAILAQDNACLICRKQFTDGKRMGRACVDHCHVTGKVRGILCGYCNSGLGKFFDQPDLLEAAIAYLQRSKVL